MIADSWEAVIGMEVHVQLSTASKMFCSCSTDYLGAPPNSRVCPVCLGMPGVLPVANRTAVEKVLKTALALNCSIPDKSKFDRKNYFYPDLPKGYQISQYDLPLSRNGWLDVEHGRVRITRAHLEEDTGSLKHAGDALHAAQESLVDLNRSGMPLMEIVSEPDIHSAEEARDYAMALRQLLRYVGASEADMEKGQLRVEPNISVRRRGDEKLGVKTELKNLNSFRALYRGVEYEIRRQVEALEKGNEIVQETRGWSEAEQRTFSQRSKEYAQDYRYFPEPDLPPIVIDPGWLDRLRGELPELPAPRRQRLVRTHHSGLLRGGCGGGGGGQAGGQLGDPGIAQDGAGAPGGADSHGLRRHHQSGSGPRRHGGRRGPRADRARARPRPDQRRVRAGRDRGSGAGR